MNSLGMLLQTALGLVLLWLLFYFGVRPYRIDAIRHRLFVLRDELFQFAASGGVAFDSRAYTILRLRINVMLRYAHTITISRVLIIGQVGKPLEKYSAKQQQRWEEGIRELSDKSRIAMEEFNNQVTLAVFRHVLLGNPLAMTVCVVDAILSGKGNKKDKELEIAREKVALLEEQAVLAQTSERDRELQLA